MRSRRGYKPGAAVDMVRLGVVGDPLPPLDPVLDLGDDAVLPVRVDVGPGVPDGDVIVVRAREVLVSVSNDGMSAQRESDTQVHRPTSVDFRLQPLEAEAVGYVHVPRLEDIAAFPRIRHHADGNVRVPRPTTTIGERSHVVPADRQASSLCRCCTRRPAGFFR